MLFKRRIKLKTGQKIKHFFSPPKGLVRSFKYIWRRIWRINATPYSISMGAAAGAFASCTPFFGLHFIIAAIIAYIFKGNIVSSALSTFVGNPLTFPIFWFINSKIGGIILGDNKRIPPLDLSKNHQHPHGWENVFNRLEDMFVSIKPVIIGSLPLGIVVGAVMYFIVYRSVKLYQRTRKKKFKS